MCLTVLHRRLVAGFQTAKRRQGAGRGRQRRTGKAAIAQDELTSDTKIVCTLESMLEVLQEG